MVVVKTQDWSCLDIGSTATTAPHRESKKRKKKWVVAGKMG